MVLYFSAFSRRSGMMEVIFQQWCIDQAAVFIVDRLRAWEAKRHSSLIIINVPYFTVHDRQHVPTLEIPRPGYALDVLDRLLRQRVRLPECRIPVEFHVQYKSTLELGLEY